MYLQKTADKANSTITSEPLERNASSIKTPPVSSTAKTVPAPPVVARSIPALITAAGLPVDMLSASIVSFARFFSLPIKPDLMAAIRRQTFTPSAMADKTADQHTVAKIREALSLAAAAAAGKGAELNSKGLEIFAEAIDPDWQRRLAILGKRDSEEQNQRGRQNKDQNKENPPNDGSISDSWLKKMALDAAEKDPLLAVLNRMPGKNGQRWIVLPFSFCEGSQEFMVSLRILLETENQSADKAVCMALDIVEKDIAGTSGHERSWLFVLDASTRLTVYLQPELPPREIALFTGALSCFMDIPPERIFVKNRTASFPCESGCGGDLLRPIDEAV